MPFICMIRTDIDAGILQVLDLSPNESQRNLVLEPPGQTKYVNRVANDTVVTAATGASDATQAAYAGVSAYLIDHVEAGGLGGGTDALTDAEVATISAALIAAMDAGSAMTLAAVNAILSATIATTELTDAGGSDSTGSLAGLLKVLAGGEYVLPSGSATEIPTGTFNPVVSGAFTAGQFRHTYDAGALNISIGEGHLSEYIAATYEYIGVTGAALVVYDDDGSVLS